MEYPIAPHPRIIFYDGSCGLCNTVVQFIIARDKAHQFRYASLQTKFAQQYLPSNFIEHLTALAYYRHGKIYTHSTAALYIARDLKGWYSILYLFIILPKSWRDYLYSLVALHRHRWFKKQNTCLLPQTDTPNLFIHD